MKQEKMTKFVQAEDAGRKWYVIDAEDQVLGRLASRVASIIRGKNKAVFTPNNDTGDFVVIVNADKVRLTGKREEQKEYTRYTGYPGGLRSLTYKQMMERNPAYVIEHAVKGMLPKNRLGKKIIKKLKVYKGAEHPHTAQKPEKLTFEE